MEHEINVKWNEKMSFTADIQGFNINLDTTPDFGGDNTGPRPKPLLLASLAGCTGMDVVSILAKMRVELKSFNVRVKGSLADEHPKRYNEITVIYEFEGDNLEYEKLEKAVKLSEERYCGVSATLRDSVKLNFEIVIK